MKRTGASPLSIPRREVAIVLVSQGVSLALPLPLSHTVSAPSEAWRFLQGESPCWVRANHPPIPSVAMMKEEPSSVRGVTFGKRKPRRWGRDVSDLNEPGNRDTNLSG